MKVQNIIKLIGLCALWIAMVSPAALAQDALQEWQAFVKEFLPPELRDPEALPDVVADLMMETEVGLQLSENFNLRSAFTAFRDKKLQINKQNRLGPKLNVLGARPQGDPNVPVEEHIYTHGEPTGKGEAAMLKFNLGEGDVKYLNRGREPDPMGEELKLNRGDAQIAAMRIAEMVGIPIAEFATVRVMEGFVAGAPNTTQITAEEPMRKRMEVLVTVLRCIHVEGNVVRGCVPVLNSGLRTAIVGDHRLGPVPNYFRAHWPDFVQPGFDLFRPKTQEDVVTDVAMVLAETAQLGSIEALQMFVVYAQNQELTGQVGSTHCAPVEEGEDDPGSKGGAYDWEPPPEWQIARQFLPAVVVYVLPITYTMDAEYDPKAGTVTTGIHVFSIPLVQAVGNCDQGEMQ